MTGIEVTLNVLAEFIGGIWVQGNAVSFIGPNPKGGEAVLTSTTAGHELFQVVRLRDLRPCYFFCQ